MYVEPSTPAEAPADLPKAERRRRGDKGALCWLAMRATEMWDFIERRNVDKHLMVWVVLVMSWDVVKWGMAYADAHPGMDGMKLAAIVVAVSGPLAIFAKGMVETYMKRNSVP